VTAGGTEANIEALWIYRNYFMKEEHAVINEIGLVFSEDSHYSIAKAGNLLGIDCIECSVSRHTREIDLNDLENKLHLAVKRGINYFIVVANMSTTMFGSTDNLDRLCTLFKMQHLNFKLHVDATFGGFMYPFTNPGSVYNFQHPSVSSVALDAHRILLAPYGCGVFMARKDLLQYVQSREVTYVKGTDHTLNGSRSGAGAVAIWMLLHAYGSGHWSTRMAELAEKTSNFSHRLHEAGAAHFHNPFMNIVCIDSKFISPHLAAEHYLVPDTHQGKPNWYRIVLMPQTRPAVLDNFVNQIAGDLAAKK
jgi:tyrosine decarboxylase / aspartate 1-decarboxylase